MPSLKSISLTLAACIAALYLPRGESSPFLLTDSRIRDLDVTPVLGRGYSLMTNTFLATCLDTSESTAPSYNYDLTYFDFTRTENYDSMMAGTLSNTFAYPYIKEQVNLLNTINNANTSSGDNSKPRTFFFVATMRVDRFYSSVKEEVSGLTESAALMLDKQDYVGFFQACGSNFVRGIRRAQEVTVVFKFDSYKKSTAQEFASLLRTVGNGSASISNSLNQQKFAPIMKSMEMKVLAYGLALNQAGTGSLVSNAIADYSAVMGYAYMAMTRTSQEANADKNIGMVYAIEVVPWVDNIAFQVAAKIQSENVEVILPRSLMTKAFHTSGDTSILWTNPVESVERESWKCLITGEVKDMYGYCCEMATLFDTVTRSYGDIRSEDLVKHAARICKPTRVLEKSIVKTNMSSNGEFVTRLDGSLRLKMNQLSDLEQCVSAVKNIPESLDYRILKPKDTAAFDAAFEFNFTVKHLKIALDPLGDNGLLKHMGKEMDEYMEMYYRKCVSQIFGGGGQDVDATLFMAEPWTVAQRCMKLNCLQENMRWDRTMFGDCVGSMMMGATAPFYPDDDEGTCALNGALSGEYEECKYGAAEMSTFHTESTLCWRNALPVGTIHYFMTQFCSPEITVNSVDQATIDELAASASGYCPLYGSRRRR